MGKKLQPNAPRFHALWESREGRSIFIMRKDDWHDSIAYGDSPFLLDLKENVNYPFSSVSDEPGYLAAVANRSDEEVSVSIYREDPKDDPFPINVDRYTIWVSFPPHVYFKREDMIRTADTDADLNFLQYEEGHVFIVKDDAGNDHWLKELPSSVVALIEHDE
jgi:hypothetical protein